MKVQESAAKKAQLSYDDGGLVQAAHSRYTYNYVLERYLGYYGIIYTGNDINNIASWLFGEIDSCKRTVLIPERMLSEKSYFVDWLDKYGMPGDLIFYKSNGTIDRAVVYLGKGKGIVRKFNDFVVGDIVTTYADNGRWTTSTGAYCIGRMWSEETEQKTITIQFVSDTERSAFEGKQYVPYEWSSDEGKYLKMTDRIIFEETPGIYTFWNGTTTSFTPEYLEEHNGLHILLAVGSGEEKPSQITWSQRYDVNWEEIADNQSNNVVISLELTNGKNNVNSSQWLGQDLWGE